MPFPKSFDDPAYDAADTAAAAKVGIDPILLQSVRKVGERSNADQVSEKGAITPYQFIPETRAAILKKYGIDVTLNPENAALGAGYLIKEGLERNGGKAQEAIAEYHGGLDRAQHGPINKAYVSRVMDATQDSFLEQLANDIKNAPATPKAAAQEVDDATVAESPKLTADAVKDDPLLDLATSIRDEPSTGAKVQDFFTGELRKTPETEAAEDWTQLPESLNNYGWKGWKTAVGTTFASPAEAAKVIKSNFPEVEVRQDAKGNYIIKSAENGKDYAIKPGFKVSDIPRAVGSVAAFSRIAAIPSIVGQAMGAAGVQAAIEGSQALTGGEFNPEEVGIAGAVGGLVPAVSRVGGAVASRLGAGKAAGAADDVAQAAPSPAAAPARAAGEPVVVPEVVPPASPSAARAAQDELDSARPPSPPGTQPYPMPNGLLRSVDDRTDGLTAIVPDDGMTIVHGSGNPKLTAEDIQIIRTAGQKQGKKGRVYGGLYGTAQQDADQAAGYAGMGGGTPTLYDVAIKPGTKVLNKNGDVTRLSESYIDDLEKQGYGLVTGKDPRGRTEFAVISKDAIEDFSPRQAAAQAAPVEAAAQAAPVEAVAESAPAPTPTPGPAESVATAAPQLGQSELAALTREAAGTGRAATRAQKILAEQAAPDAATVKSAERLGIADNLQADHVTTNQEFRELSQAIKSVPGSSARAQELEGLRVVAKRADDLVEELGGTHDLSTLSQNIKNGMVATGDQLEEQANQLYRQIREAIPTETRAAAPKVLEFIQGRANAMGGVENLSTLEKSIVKKLSPKTVTTTEKVPARAGVTSASTRKVDTTLEPRYALVDDVRQTIGNAARARGPFSDADTGLAKKLYSLITEDQDAAAGLYGMAEISSAAKAAVRTRKALENDTVALFGKNLGNSLVGNLAAGTKALAAGDTAKFLKVLNAVPKDQRQEVVASALNYAFGKSAKSGDMSFHAYARWFEGLQKNKQAYTAVMSNLPPSARESLHDLYKVSNGISLSSKERIVTGRLNAITKELEGADTAMERVYDVVKKVAGTAALEGASSAVGLPGAGLAAGLMNALKTKTPVMQAADKLLSSPEFIAMARASATSQGPKAATVKRLAASKQMAKFFKEAGSPPEMRDHEKWLMSLFQSSNQTKK